MRRWVISFGIALLAGAVVLLYLRNSNSIEKAITRVHPGSSITYPNSAKAAFDRVQLIWYLNNNRPYVAWVSKGVLGWRVKAWREIPDVPSATQVGWTAWNPAETWGLLLAQVPPSISEIQVDERTANHVEGTGVWWVYFDRPLAPPIKIVGYNLNHVVAWQYPQ